MLEGCSQVGVEGQVRWSALWDPVRYMDFILGAVGSQRWVLNREECLVAALWRTG